MKKGFKHSQETKDKMRVAKLGVKRPDMVGNTLRKGVKDSDITRKKKSEYLLNNPRSPWLGKKLSKEHKSKIVKFGEQNGMWKGDDVGYSALHKWIYRKKGKAVKCEKCGVECKCSWANLSGEYKRDVRDFISLCYSCHKKFDSINIKI